MKKEFIMRQKLRLRLFCAHSLSFIITCFCIACALFVGHTSFTNTFNSIIENNTRHQQPDVEELTLTVTPDTTFETIAEALYTRGFIGNEALFNLTSLSYHNKPLIEGTYTLTNNLSNEMILTKLTSKPKAVEEQIKLTIPEGYTVAQIARKVDDLGLVPYDTFLKAANTVQYDYDFLADVPTDIPYPLEGYLFPDTYFITPDSSAESIIIKMLDRFEVVISQYTHYLHQSDYSLHDSLTIASIIEAEARVSEERPIIAGVIYNRLDADMKLQMCSSIQYSLDERKASLSYDDLAIDSPYNTYLYEGLPPAPLGCPGQASIEATFIPSTHNYFFFVLADTQSGTHHFSHTAEEHAFYKSQYDATTDQNFVD